MAILSFVLQTKSSKQVLQTTLIFEWIDRKDSLVSGKQGEDPGFRKEKKKSAKLLMMTFLPIILLVICLMGRSYVKAQVADPPPPSSKPATAGRNHLNLQNTPSRLHPPPPTAIGERYSQSLSNLCQAALLRWCELRPTSENAELTQWAL